VFVKFFTLKEKIILPIQFISILKLLGTECIALVIDFHLRLTIFSKRNSPKWFEKTKRFISKKDRKSMSAKNSDIENQALFLIRIELF